MPECEYSGLLKSGLMRADCIDDWLLMMLDIDGKLFDYLYRVQYEKLGLALFGTMLTKHDKDK